MRSFLSSSPGKQVGNLNAFSSLIKDIREKINKIPLTTSVLNTIESYLRSFESQGNIYLKKKDSASLTSVYAAFLSFKRQFWKIQKMDFLEIIENYLNEQIDFIDENFARTIERVQNSTTEITEIIKESQKRIKKLKKTPKKLREIVESDLDDIQVDTIFQACQIFDSFRSDLLSRYKILFENANCEQLESTSRYSKVLFHIGNCYDALSCAKFDTKSKNAKPKFENFWKKGFHHSSWSQSMEKYEAETTRIFGKPKHFDTTFSEIPKKPSKKSYLDSDSTGTMIDSQLEDNSDSDKHLSDAKLDKISKQLREIRADVTQIKGNVEEQALRQLELMSRETSPEELEENNKKLEQENAQLLAAKKELQNDNQRMQSIIRVTTRMLKGEKIAFDENEEISQLMEEKTKLMVRNEELERRLINEQNISWRALTLGRLDAAAEPLGQREEVWSVYKAALRENEMRRNKEKEDAKIIEKLQVSHEKKKLYKAEADEAKKQIVELELKIKEITNKQKTEKSTTEIIEKLNEMNSSIMEMYTSNSGDGSQELLSLKSEIKSLNKQATIKDSYIEDLKKQISKSEENNKTLMKQVANASESSALKDLIEQEKSENAKLREQIINLTKENTKLSTTIKTLTTENTDIKNTVKVLNSKIETMTTTNEEMRKSTISNDTTMQQETQKLTEQLKKANEDIQTLKEELKKANDEIVKRKKQRDDYYGNAMALQDKLKATIQEKIGLEEYKKKFDKLIGAKSSIDQLHHDFGELQELYNSNEDQIIKWKGETINREDIPARIDAIKKEHDEKLTKFSKMEYTIIFKDNCSLIIANDFYKKIADEYIKSRNERNEVISKALDRLEQLESEKIAISGSAAAKKCEEISKKIRELQETIESIGIEVSRFEAAVQAKKGKGDLSQRIRSLQEVVSHNLAAAKWCKDLKQIPEDYNEYYKATRKMINTESDDDDDDDDDEDSSN